MNLMTFMKRLFIATSALSTIVFFQNCTQSELQTSDQNSIELSENSNMPNDFAANLSGDEDSLGTSLQTLATGRTFYLSTTGSDSRTCQRGV